MTLPEESAKWTGKWAAPRLEKLEAVERVDLLAPQILNIIRTENSPFLAGTIASPCVKESTIKNMLDGSFSLEFIANIPPESFWTGAAIDCVSHQSVAFGGMGDLFSAVKLPNVRRYENKEFAFVERGLHQHTKVSRLQRVHDRKYLVKRYDLNDVDVVLVNTYAVTADDIRTARERYGPFKAVLKTNPNGGITESAEQAAESMGARIFEWGEFMKYLHREIV